MNLTQQSLVLLLRSALTGERLDLAKEIDLEGIFAEASRHSVISMAYIGAINCGIDRSLPVMQNMLRTYYSELARSEKQLFLTEKIFRVFEENGIDYMPLKGCSIKKLYPKPEMRKMNDADILIRESDYDKAKKIVEELGFKKDNRDGDHSRNFESDDLYLELHIRLFARNEFPIYAEYFGDGWGRARHVDGHCYEMSAEDEFIFIFVHFVKHYISGGVGCRHLCDLWIFLENNSDIDRKYIEVEVEKIGLGEFYKNLTNTLEVCFGDGLGDEKTAAIAAFVLGSGQWGTAITYNLARSVRSKKTIGNSRGVRLYTLWKTIFPAFSAMKKTYPILEKHWYLLPFMWVARWIGVVVYRHDKITKKTKELELISAKNIDAYEDALRFVGLNWLK